MIITYLFIYLKHQFDTNQRSAHAEELNTIEKKRF